MIWVVFLGMVGEARFFTKSQGRGRGRFFWLFFVSGHTHTQTDTRTRKMAGREGKNRSYSSGSGKNEGAQSVRQSQAPVNICRLALLFMGRVVVVFILTRRGKSLFCSLSSTSKGVGDEDDKDKVSDMGDTQKIKWRDEQQPLLGSLRSLVYLLKAQDKNFGELLPDETNTLRKQTAQSMKATYASIDKFVKATALREKKYREAVLNKKEQQRRARGDGKDAPRKRNERKKDERKRDDREKRDDRSTRGGNKADRKENTPKAP